MIQPGPRPLSRQEALALGLTASRLRGRGVRHPHRDVYVLGPPATKLADRCRVALPTLPTLAVFSHATAAALWRLADCEVMT